MSLIEGIKVRILFYIAAILVGLAFMVLVPQKKFFFTKLGQNTLGIYMFHLLVINAMVKINIANIIVEKYSAYILLLIGVAMTFIFSAGFWQKPLCFILNRQLPIFKKEMGSKFEQ